MQTIFFTVTNDLSYDQRMIRICSSLSKAGYQVTLVGRKRPSSIPLKTQSFDQKRLYCFFQKGKLFYLEYNLRLFFFLSFKKYDALSAIDLDTLGPLFLLHKLGKKPLIYDAHEYFTEVPEVVDRAFTKWVWEKLAQWTIPKLQYCYTVGPQLALLFQERYGPEFKVIRNVPVSAQIEFSEPDNLPAIPSGVRVLLYQGALNQGRGLECCIEAMLLLPESVHLWLLGEGDLSEELRDLSKQLDLQKRVHFLGFRPPHELPTITSKAQLGLNLLENKGLSYYYSLANKCFDYIQAELPAIHMDFPEYRALYQQHQAFTLLSDLDPALLASIVQGLFENTNAYEAMQQACRAAALVWNWEIEEKTLLALYQTVFLSQK
jgi:glycosyltransferase involved in cell wall biosynthesis